MHYRSAFRSVWASLLFCAAVAAAGQFPSQPAELLPRASDNGVLFQCYVPEARQVYLAADFNNWAENQGGRITNTAFAMQGPDFNGVWRKTVKLAPGIYHFKFNLNGEPDQWFTPDSITGRDPDNNAVIYVTPTADVIVTCDRDPRWQPRVNGQSVLFQLHAPQAHLVALAADFNNWAGNRRGLVFNPQFVMRGLDSNGVWQAEVKLTPGRHEYQFVIDGDHWLADPNAITNAANGHSVIEIQ